MTATSDSALEFAVLRLRWCLNKPLVCGGRDWGACVYRALVRLGEAFEGHLDHLDGPAGPLAQFADPSYRPFTPEAKRVSELRRDCERLREQIQLVSLQFRDAMLLFPCGSKAPADAIADARAYRLYGVLGSCAVEVLEALEKYRLAVASLLKGTQDSPAAIGQHVTSGTEQRPSQVLR
jgi:hypothetical protein